MATTPADDRDAGASLPQAPKKMSIWFKLLLGVIVLIGVLVVVIAMQPSHFRVSRSTTMAAPQATVFEQINDFHKWDAWSPWAKLDPNAKNTFEGPTSGVGSILRWDGDANVGAGSMEILESKPNEHVRIELAFIRPMEGTSDVHFTFKPEAEGRTAVTWTMEGENNFIAKAISLMIDCDKMMGEQFEKGLANIKAVVEAPPAN